MKKLLLTLILPLIIMAQEITIQKIEPAVNPELGQFYHPSISPKGMLFFTQSNYVGLYYFDEQNQKIITVSDLPGSGYQPTFSENGKYIYFRSHTYKSGRKYSSLIKRSLQNNRNEVLIADQRDFTSPFRLKTGEVVVSLNEDLREAEKLQDKKATDSPAVFIEKSKIAIYKDGTKNLLQPLGNGHYLWPSVSPDGQKLLFTKAGTGTYISDLKGNIISDLGYANAPQWSPNGKWIVYMDDKDDGHQVISSDINIISVDGKKRFAITNTPDIIETYPVWGLDSKTLFFDSQNGVIYKASLKVN